MQYRDKAAHRWLIGVAIPAFLVFVFLVSLCHGEDRSRSAIACRSPFRLLVGRSGAFAPAAVPRLERESAARARRRGGVLGDRDLVGVACFAGRGREPDPPGFPQWPWMARAPECPRWSSDRRRRPVEPAAEPQEDAGRVTAAPRALPGSHQSSRATLLSWPTARGSDNGPVQHGIDQSTTPGSGRVAPAPPAGGVVGGWKLQSRWRWTGSSFPGALSICPRHVHAGTAQWICRGETKRDGNGRIRCSRTPQEMALRLGEFSDVNWHRGVSRSEAAILIEDAKMASQLVPGDSLKLPSGQWRIVQRVRTEGGAVWLEGGPFGKDEFDQSRQVTINLSRSAAREHALQLWDRAFRIPDLGKIPISWGKSWHSLERRVEPEKSWMTFRSCRRTCARQARALRSQGPDPRLSLDIGPKKIAGRDVGLLGFDFTCAGKRAEPRLQVYWWGDEDNGPREVASVKFAAEDGMLVIPLDASPRWVVLDQVRGIRIDLDTPNACSGVEHRGFGLDSARAFTRSP